MEGVIVKDMSVKVRDCVKSGLEKNVNGGSVREGMSVRDVSVKESSVRGVY
jgi:hypothetical protein